MDYLEEKILDLIEANSQEIITLGRDIYDHGEMGFKEYRTAELAECFFAQRGITYQKGLAVTGVKGYLKAPKKGEFTVALIGEMDALPISNHSHTNPETGAAHCCGHNAQIAALLGAVIGLEDSEVKEALGGNVAFMAVPAEEFVDIQFKESLMQKEIIEFGGGKSELIRIGAFDDIAVAVGHHIAPDTPGYTVANGSTNGFVNKIVDFYGKTAHAAGFPEQGVDALNAAMLALHAVDMQRETFRDEDSVRIHSYLPKAGEAMNIISEHTSIESSVRAKTLGSIQDASNKYNRSMRAGAVGLGCGGRIITIPGYLPTIPLKDPQLMADVLKTLSREAEKIGYRYPVEYRGSDYHEAGSTDFGDLSNLIPLYQFRTGGYSGALHSSSIQVSDEKLAYVEAAKAFALTAYRLLKNQAKEGRQIQKSFQPELTKEAYIAYMRKMRTTEEIHL